MPRQKIVKESEDEFEYILDCLNNKNNKEKKSLSEEYNVYKGFQKNECGIYVNKEGYVMNFKKKVIIGKLDDRKMFEYLEEEDIEWCEKNGFRYKEFI